MISQEIKNKLLERYYYEHLDVGDVIALAYEIGYTDCHTDITGDVDNVEFTDNGKTPQTTV